MNVAPASAAVNEPALPLVADMELKSILFDRAATVQLAVGSTHYRPIRSLVQPLEVCCNR
jgi:hypothetical protein